MMISQIIIVQNKDFQIEDNPKTEDYSKLYGAGF